MGFAYGTVGVIALTLGGILGGLAVARHGLRRCLWPMVCLVNLPNAVYIVLSWFPPEAFWVVVAGIVLEQFGYGFGFAAYLLYMIYIARGQHQTAHYALCTGFMALGMMLPGMGSGWLQEAIGYPSFFLWVMVATMPGFVMCALIPLEAGFGKRAASPG